MGGAAGGGANANGQGKAQARGHVNGGVQHWPAVLTGVGGVVAGVLLALMLQDVIRGKPAVSQVQVRPIRTNYMLCKSVAAWCCRSLLALVTSSMV
jgi:hypothetical protein